MKKVLFAIALGGCSNNTVPEEAMPRVAQESPSERGKLLAMTHGCHDCHTPLKPDGKGGAEPDFSRQLSGHPAALEMPPAPEPQGPWMVSAAATNTAWAGPWGVSFTANLTPDDETGTGTWSEQTFIATIRNGKHMGVGRPLLPPMPAPMYAKMSDADLGAIYAYLRTIPAIKNKVPEPRAPKGQVSAAPAPAAAGQVARQ